MSETSLPFDEKYYPSSAKISSGEKRKQDWEKSIKDPQEYWREKAKAIDWFKPFSKFLMILTRLSTSGSLMEN